MEAYTTADLLESIKQRAVLPDNQTTWSDEKLLIAATEEMRSVIVPLLMSVREEYFVTYEDVAIVSGTSRYAIPERAVGMGVRELLWIDTNGNAYPMPMITVEDGEVTSSTWTSTSGSGTSPYAYRLEWNSIVLSPAPTAVGTMRVMYVVSPGELCETDDAARITTIDTATNTVSCSTVPAAWSGGESVDIIKGSGGYEYLSTGASIVAVNGTDVTLSALPSGLSVGDWVSIEGQSPIPQLPRELQPLLAHKVVVQILESMTQTQAAKQANDRVNQMIQSALSIISPRNKGGAKKLVAASYF
jgi:hypothetical protein